jgi:hypothetical protein
MENRLTNKTVREYIQRVGITGYLLATRSWIWLQVSILLPEKERIDVRGACTKNFGLLRSIRPLIVRSSEKKGGRQPRYKWHITCETQYIGSISERRDHQWNDDFPPFAPLR